MEEAKTRKSSIPQELVFEIFSWLPVKSLMRFKCVAKFCNSLGSESNVVDIHHVRSITRNGGIKFFMHQTIHFYIIEPKGDGKASRLHIENFGFVLDFIYDHITYVNGLFCCSKKNVERVAICNPATRVARYLPRLKELVEVNNPEYFCSIGFEPEEKRYKVLMMLNNSSRSLSTRNWVLTLGTDDSWREIKSIIDYFPLNDGVCIDGVIYMLNYGKSDTFIVAFDVKVENFRIIKLWKSIYPLVGSYNLIKVKANLAILYKKGGYLGGYLDDDNMELWVLGNKSRKEEWENHIIRIPSQWRYLNGDRLLYPTFQRICSTCEGGIVFLLEIRSGIFVIWSFNVAEKTWRLDFDINGVEKMGGIIYGIYSYVESLFSLEF